ncbi:LytR/AlgR family response regulator transcription factor [Chryseobacterium paridis]|uniref:LytTR family transcriptional regulator DNA-binding domain-containing protein n=1 Tax=Chryseobacterium paridis TaxID=2800328 RepID=A0ABS1FSZ6_9FLAO|nr:LytTR family transcriptional regulator DNA-binding domain-containing protein [Chryseobacterium paridis]MBK1895545.1 LytTR family transcriptional regulator DNA-binding domain-containing protein [Chryseobacterium paridis]
MKKINLYTITFFAVSIIILLISFLSFRYLYSSSKEDIFNSKIEAGKRESREIGKLLELQLKQGLSKEVVIQNLQSSIVNTDTQSGFICMYNRNGIELCHPNPALIGHKIDKNNSDFVTGDQNQSDFADILNSGQISAGVRNFPEKMKRSSEIVSVYPVQGSDWMVASHANINSLEQQITNLYQKFLLVFIIASLIILGISFIVIRWIYKKYEDKKNEIINDLNLEINNLTTLNKQLNTIQEKYQEIPPIRSDESITESSKKRIITYHKDELISLETSEIAYFFLESNTVYLLTFKGGQYSINSSLDEIIKTLDNEMFYRANRQFIINIKAIGSILMYGKNQLKLVVQPESSETILISKNKVAEFKKWIEQ